MKTKQDEKNKSKSKTKTKAIYAVLLLVVLALGVLVAVPSGAAAEEQTAEEKTIAELQQEIYEQGYNYTVAENRITRLPAEERAAVCGYKPLKAPEDPVPDENIRFVADAPSSQGAKTEAEAEVRAPSSYDAMALGFVTPVKDQSYPIPCGSCWIFGATAEFESDVAIGEGTLLDFAEQEVGDCNIWSSVGGYDFCDGGNAFMTTNFFTKHGAADEACHPYAATPQTCQDCPILKKVDNWRMITGSSGESQITTIKNAILNYGPVYSTIYANAGFKAYNSGVYEYWEANETNHAIEIIGWDDSLTHSHGSGAWLIKNSWGTDWGTAGPYPGCAWVAYGAANLGDYTSAVTGYNDFNTDDEIFYHDECGWMGWCTGYGTPTAYGAVRFTPTQDTTLTAVDFWAVNPGMQYEIKIFDTRNAVGSGKYTFSSQLGTTQTVTTNEPGYYSVPLTTTVPLTAGDDFIVQVKATTTTGWGYPAPIDYCTDSDLNWAGIATSSGESYVSPDGTEFEKYGTGGKDLGIRARAEREAPEEPEISVETDKFEYCLGETMEIKIAVSNPTSSPVTLKWFFGSPTLGVWLPMYVGSLPAGYANTFVVLLPVEKWSETPFSAVWYVDLQDPETGKELAADCACWSYAYPYCPKCESEPKLTQPLEKIAAGREIGEQIKGSA